MGVFRSDEHSRLMRLEREAVSVSLLRDTERGVGATRDHDQPASADAGVIQKDLGGREWEWGGGARAGRWVDCRRRGLCFGSDLGHVLTGSGIISWVGRRATSESWNRCDHDCLAGLERPLDASRERIATEFSQRSRSHRVQFLTDDVRGELDLKGRIVKRRN